jgi:hypothetical protein
MLANPVARETVGRSAKHIQNAFIRPLIDSGKLILGQSTASGTVVTEMFQFGQFTADLESKSIRRRTEGIDH